MSGASVRIPTGEELKKKKKGKWDSNPLVTCGNAFQVIRTIISN